jgi:hypothetical protein
LRKFQKGINCLGTKVYNNLPQYIKDMLSDIKSFEVQLKQFLYLHSFYSLQEYLCYKSDCDLVFLVFIVTYFRYSQSLYHYTLVLLFKLL